MAGRAFSQPRDTYETVPAVDNDDPKTWFSHLNQLLCKRKSLLDIVPTFQDEWRAYLEATAELKFHRDAAQVQRHTINIDTISHIAMSHVMQMSVAQSKTLKIYHKILGLMRADLARLDEIETLAKKVLALPGKLKVVDETEKKRTELVVSWVKKTRGSIFTVLGEIKKNSI